MDDVVCYVGDNYCIVDGIDSWWLGVGVVELVLYFLDSGISGDFGFGNDFFLIKEILLLECC